MGHEGDPDALFILTGGQVRDPGVTAWLGAGEPLRDLAARAFEHLRACGADVRELMHDGNPTACVDDAAFAYVAAYTRHAAVGFFHGIALDDPCHLLHGSGKRMRHVKLYPGEPVDGGALSDLIAAAYRDIRNRVRPA